jgi:hypothetical protein
LPFHVSPISKNARFCVGRPTECGAAVKIVKRPSQLKAYFATTPVLRANRGVGRVINIPRSNNSTSPPPPRQQDFAADSAEAGLASVPFRRFRESRTTAYWQ